jgi:hypothetical protein
VTTAAIALTGEEALKLVAGAPDIADKTPAELREAADQFEQAAGRKDRLILPGGSRRGARNKAREREGEKLRIQAQVTRAAAEEVEAQGPAIPMHACVLLNRADGRSEQS